MRYRAKRQMRNFNKTVKYQCRKSLADTRPRVRGRFARDNEPGSVLPHETKKAIREKTTTTSPMEGSGDQQGSPQSQEELRAGSASPVLLKSEPMPHAHLLGPEIMPMGGRSMPQHQDRDAASQSTSDMDQHASLAHLYNMWSDGGGAEQQQQINLQGTSSNSA